MKAWEIVGYIYRSEVLHPLCAVLEYAGDSDPYVSAETALDRYAERVGINREDERSFDSGDFPKVIFASQVGDAEHCDRCGGELL